MFLNILSRIPGVLSHVEFWVGGALWGLLMLWSLNFLAAGYTGSRSAFDVVMSLLVFVGIGIYFLLIGPAMLFGSSTSGHARTFGFLGIGTFEPSRAFIALGLGLLFALLTRICVRRNRLFSCLPQVFAMLGVTVYFGTNGTGQFMPSPLALLGVGMTGLLVVIIAVALIESLFPQRAARTWIALSPVLLAIAASPYASWVRVVNRL